MKLVRLLLASSKVLFALILVFVLWQGWVFMRPRPRTYAPAEVEALREVCRQLADELSTALKENRGTTDAGELPRIGIAHLLQDPSDKATAVLRETLGRGEEWTVEESSVIQKFLSDVTDAVANATTLDEVLHAGRRVDLDVIVGGKVDSVTEQGENSASAAITFLVYDLRQGNELIKKTVSADWESGVVARGRRGLINMHPALKILIWLAIVGLLPWVSSPATHHVLERKSNLASFVLLTAYTAVDLLCGLVLAGFHIAGAANSLWLVGAFVLCAGYNYWACEKIGCNE